MFADPTEPGISCQRFLQYRSTVYESTVTESADLLFDAIGEPLQPFAHYLVIVTTKCVAGHETKLAAVQHGIDIIRVFSEVIHTN